LYRRRFPIEEREGSPTHHQEGNEHFAVDGAILFKHACALGSAGIVSKRLGSPYRSGRVAHGDGSGAVRTSRLS
jgi:hypothetical protein